MATAVVCNNCGDIIDKSRLNDYTVVCNNCGKVHSAREIFAEKTLYNFVIRGQIIAIVAAVMLFAHIRNWDSYFVTIIPSKAKQLTGLASVDDHMYVAKACESLKKLDCYADSLGRILDLQPENMDLHRDRGLALHKIKNYQQASTALGHYFSLNGKDIASAIAYAESLDHSGELKKAERMYKWVLGKRKNVLQLSVTKKYVHVLLKRKKMYSAKSMIKYIQKRSQSAPRFMMKELREIDRNVQLAKK